MLELLKNTKIVHKSKFILACVLWFLVSVIFGFLLESIPLTVVGTFAVGLFAYWQLDAPKSKSGEDVVGLLVVMGSVLLGWLFADGLSAFLEGGIKAALENTVLSIMIIAGIVAIALAMVFWAQRIQHAPKISEEKRRKKLRRAGIYRTCAVDCFVMGVLAIIIDLAIMIADLDIETYNYLIDLWFIDTMLGTFLLIASILIEKTIGASFYGAAERGESLTEEESAYLRWEQERTESAREAKLQMDIATITPGVWDNLAAAEAGMSKLSAWKADKAPFLLRHIALFLNLLAVGAVIWLFG